MSDLHSCDHVVSLVKHDLCTAQVDLKLSRKHVEALHLRIKEYRHELALCKKEAKRAAKALRHAEVGLQDWRERHVPCGCNCFEGFRPSCSYMSAICGPALTATEACCRRQL